MLTTQAGVLRPEDPEVSNPTLPQQVEMGSWGVLIMDMGADLFSNIMQAFGVVSRHNWPSVEGEASNVHDR